MVISNLVLTRFIEQSNMIEGIMRKPTKAEFEAHQLFVELDRLSITDLQAFVSVVQPGAVVRDQPSLNVRIGSHVAPQGGVGVVASTNNLLMQVNEGGLDAWRAHCIYETIHPFTDGNGRSGRALWLWQMKGRALPPGLFLHRFYYQTLENFRA